jgi:hypothetical protein
MPKDTKLKINYELSLDELPVGNIRSHFLDSGAFTLWTKLAGKYAKENNCEPIKFFDSQEFWDYVDAYAKFVKKKSDAIDLFANVDAIPPNWKALLKHAQKTGKFDAVAKNVEKYAELTWRNQKYIEKEHGITPVPVVHYFTDFKWLHRYIDEGYDLIGLGGLVGSTAKDHCREWIDKAFNIVCDTKNRLPKVKIHGFGVTTYELLLRYPWWSVDSTSWTKIGAFGGILVPRMIGGKFSFDKEPFLIKVSDESPDRKKRLKHILTLSSAEQLVIAKWLDLIDIPLGKRGKDGETIEEYGVITHHTYRRAANLLFFEKMRESLPEWPWAFTSTRRKGFGLT